LILVLCRLEPVVTLALLNPDDRTTIQHWTLTPGVVIRVGRSLDNQIILAHSLVSRHHCELQCRSDGSTTRWWLSNRGKNGTLVNGVEIQRPVILKSKDLIQLSPKGPLLQLEIPGPDRATTIQASVQASVQASAHAAQNQAQPQNPRPVAAAPPCKHEGNQADALVCRHCGKPIQVLHRIRHYHILRGLAQGGMGTTFLAWTDPADFDHPLLKTSRLVVFKQMNEDIASIPKARELFEREAMALRTLHHPGIPQFLDFCAYDDQPYLVMELIHGENLEHYITDRGAATVPQAIEWMIQVCDVLEFLHQQTPSILHRDIKPANLLRRQRDGRIMVVDFGAVKQQSSVMGTYIWAQGYSAPEQEEGFAQVQSDLYSIGASLLFLLTGRSPDQICPIAGKLQLTELMAIPKITPSLAAVIHHLMQEDPKNRYPDAKSLKQALRTCLLHSTMPR
jgi:serine/threonine protein kinase, bacterial